MSYSRAMDENPETPYIVWTTGEYECRVCGQIFTNLTAFNLHQPDGLDLVTNLYPPTLHKLDTGVWSN